MVGIDEFMETIREFPDDHQKLCYFKDNLIFNKVKEDLGLVC